MHVGDELTPPFRHARRFPSTLIVVRESGICSSFKGKFLSPRAKHSTIRNLWVHTLSKLFMQRSTPAYGTMPATDVPSPL
jgi:hypothetical protein